MKSLLGGFSDEALEAYQQAVAESKGADFSESDTYDFTKCVKPDGSTYGTSGKCVPPSRPANSAPKGKESYTDKQKRMLKETQKAGFNPLAQSKLRGDRARQRNAMVMNAIKGLFGKK
jgi:hypothetical protein